MRRFLLLFILLLNFSTFTAHADDPLSTSTSTDVNQSVPIDLPPDLPIGHHSATVEVTDPETGEVTTQEINFCKDLLGEIHWDDNCPDLEAVPSPASVENVTSVQALPPYSPASEPDKTATTQVAGFTALSVLSAGGAAAAASGGFSGGGAGGGSAGGAGGGSGARGGGTPGRKPENDGSSEGESRAEEMILHAAHSTHSHTGGTLIEEIALIGVGDRSRTWKAPLTPTIDSAFLRASSRISRLSPLMSKMLVDASYLRAIFGSLSAVTIPAALVLGVDALLSSHQQPMPPKWNVALAMILLGLIDALAGMVAGSVFVLGTLTSGHINSLENLLTVLAFAAICAAPSIIANSFRPLRRRVGISDHPWERAADYGLAAVLTGWTLSKFIGTLNVIAGKQLPIVGHATKIGLFVGIGVILRMVVEDIATYLYPQRLAQFKIITKSPSKRQQYFSNFIKGTVFALVMKTFVGLNLQLLLGTAFFILPSLLKLSIGHVLPKSRLLHFAIPKGAIRIVAMTIVGTTFALFSKKVFTNSHDFLTWGFVLLSLPSFVLSLLELASDQKGSPTWRNHPAGKFVYRSGGLIILFLIIQIVLGHDLTSYFRHLLK